MGDMAVLARAARELRKAVQGSFDFGEPEPAAKPKKATAAQIQHRWASAPEHSGGEMTPERMRAAADLGGLDWLRSPTGGATAGSRHGVYRITQQGEGGHTLHFHPAGGGPARVLKRGISKEAAKSEAANHHQRQTAGTTVRDEAARRNLDFLSS